MKLPTIFKQFSILETVLLFLFIIFIIFPINIPSSIGTIINSPLGMVMIFGIIISLFVFTNPILGVVYILVAYELLRRSSNITVYKNSALRRPNVSRYMNSPHSIVNAPVIDIMSNYNETPLPILYPTLEENIVAERTPIGRSDSNTYIDTLFKPIYDKNTGSAYV